MIRRSAVVAAAGALALGCAVPAAAADGPCTSGADCAHTFDLAGGGEIPYLASYPLTGASTVTEAVVVIHGAGRNADGYFERMVEATGDAGAGDRTEIVAPHFQTSDDDPGDDEVTWTNGGDTSWKDGGDSVSSPRVSSFTVVDEILAKLADRKAFPKLARITLAGHSAGGQFTQRYAAGGKAPARLTGVSFHFVPANPSSYLYFTPDRPVAGGLPDSCPGYDDYKYGLKQLNPYLSGYPAGALARQYTAREVTYLLGGDDVHQDHGIDQSCEAEAQGHHRLERGENYFSALHKACPDAPHEQVLVPGVGHDSGAMFDSEPGRNALFG
ncbi:alpha/beta fold hydrolase [Amycolatopsis jiangsuensis]|uniref:Pimeloyl-ACP methyl ester carboxylesterase n=1 Tax=Amycolatopsis jiangsuensis TaxID=1181879 RepID=A0A840J702_9PSEU|nr:alpha/beta hydrolase [Amycolatopsis jiangsuensis]MBB4689489.1 pimeloyl-ACP methyl ester carboxylesterase [Amycolatopsis jiangsuensis]